MAVRNKGLCGIEGVDGRLTRRGDEDDEVDWAADFCARTDDDLETSVEEGSAGDDVDVDDDGGGCVL